LYNRSVFNLVYSEKKASAVLIKKERKKEDDRQYTGTNIAGKKNILDTGIIPNKYKMGMSKINQAFKQNTKNVLVQPSL
jgi:hypothetical protein